MKRTAIITGASRGIGYAAAKKLGINGCQVVLFATGEKERYKEALDKLTEAGINWHYVRGSLDCKDLLEMTEESFDRVMGVNTKGTMFLTQLAANQMIKQEQIFKSRGHIVNVGSCSAEVSSTSRGEYCVSKAAVSMLTTLFADRLASEGILVNEVRPGVIATDMTSVVTEKYDTMIKNGVFPIARWGKAEDVAEMIAFFCSDNVLYTTGNYVDVDGGFHIKRL